MKKWNQLIQRKGRIQHNPTPSPSTVNHINGPIMKGDFFNHAEDIFGIYSSDDDIDGYAIDEEPQNGVGDIQPYQLSLPLYSIEEQQEHLNRLIRKYELSLEKMGEYALKWVSMEQAASRNQQLGRLWRDVKMTKKIVTGDNL